MEDVIVIGAGPAGSYVAWQLASSGFKVVVLEEHAKVGEPVRCTGIIGREAYERFLLSEKAIIRTANSATFFSPAGSPMRLKKEKVQAYIVDRTAFDTSLAEKAQEAGAHYLLSSKVAGIHPAEDGVSVEIATGNGGRNIEGRAAVIASGFGSRLPERVGLGKMGDYVLGAQAEVKTRGVEEVEVYFGQNLAPGFFAWLVPLESGRGLVGLFSRRNPGQHLKDFLGMLSQQGKVEGIESRVTYGGIPLRSLPRTSASRVLVVGDAAGQVKPTTGGGVYYALLCAEVATETLKQGFSTGDFSARLFARYHKGWAKRLGWELQIGCFARQLYEKLEDSQIEEIFRIVKSNGIHEYLLQSEGFSFDWHAGLIGKALRHKEVRSALWQMKGILFS